VQPKLLRALQQGEVQRIGADRVLRVDVRVIAATNRDLVAEQRDGRFRGDLYHRLAVYPLHVPPLRERREDVPIIAGAVLEREAVRLGCGGARLDAAARTALVAYPWPGNVRELEHVLTRALVRAAGPGERRREAVIGVEHLGLGGESTPAIAGASPRITVEEVPTLRQRLDAAARQEVAGALARHGGRWTPAARQLGLTPSNLQRLAARLGLRPGSDR
jgi:anaerobic nitric oxide reductase transcription regulator